MAYQTGTASSAANLLSIIQSFAVANGFTLTGNVLSTSNSWTKVTAFNGTFDPYGTPASENYQFVGFQGGLDTTFAANTSPTGTVLGNAVSAAVCIANSMYPVTYHLFYNDNPKEIFGVVNYAVNYHQHFSFGEIQKSSSLYTGGGFFHATCAGYDLSGNGGGHVLDFGFSHDDSYGMGIGCGGFFAGGYSTTRAFAYGRNSFVYTSSNNFGWGANILGGTINNGTSAYPNITHIVGPLIIKLPNLWNNQTVLLPCRLFKAVSATYCQDLGSITHVRYTKMDYLQPGDIITLGSEQWKVFPLVSKNTLYSGGFADTSYYNGRGGTTTQLYHTGPQTGTYALAYRYTP